MGSDTSTKPLHIAFFPLMSPGHFLPMIDMARIFASRGVTATVITTPSNAATIPSATSSSINIATIPFPDSTQTNLPSNIENLADVPTSLFTTFTNSLSLLRPSLESQLSLLKPDCIISDALFPWTADVAANLNIPRIIFHGAGAFPLFMTTAIFAHFPLDGKDSFVVDGLPHKLTLHARGLPELFQDIPFLMQLGEGEAKSHGVVINTYRDMEPTYVDFHKGMRKAWCVGPVFLCNKSDDEKTARGGGGGGGGTPLQNNKEEIVRWLDSKPEGSVVYVCFGSLCHFSAAQLREIAVGLDESGVDFLWVVRKEPEADEAEENEWMPEGYAGRVGDRGLVVRGWAPQAVVLGHKATGWFVTHCGWNSLQEGVCAGVPMLTWPLFHEQFINAELLVEVMGVGVRMWEGFRREGEGEGVVVTAAEVAGVVRRVMAGGEDVFERMKAKAREYGEMATAAVEEGGSSYRDVTALIEELEDIRNKRVSE